MLFFYYYSSSSSSVVLNSSFGKSPDGGKYLFLETDRPSLLLFRPFRHQPHTCRHTRAHYLGVGSWSPLQFTHLSTNCLNYDWLIASDWEIINETDPVPYSISVIHSGAINIYNVSTSINAECYECVTRCPGYLFKKKMKIFLKECRAFGHTFFLILSTYILFIWYMTAFEKTFM